MKSELLTWLRVLVLAAAGLFVAVQLAGCEAEDFVTWATVLDVQDADAAPLPKDLDLRDDDLRIPEVGWKLELRLDDGETVSVTRNGGRRFQPGDRVRLLRSDDGELLL
jgi:outer membrane lipoprotein SlyB